MNEHQHLINDYLCVNKTIRNAGFHAISAEQCNQLLHGLIPYERPDMYADLDDLVIILEHFEFDASRQNRKGMMGKEEENHLKRRIEQAKPDGKFYIDCARYDISLEDWQKNFESCFQSHYDRIDVYKRRITDIIGNNEKPIRIGFFVENQFSPIINIFGDIAELQYCDTVQFANVILANQNIDFLLFGGYINGKAQIKYIDRVALEIIYDNLIDLQDERVTLSHINSNEAVIYGAGTAEQFA